MPGEAAVTRPARSRAATTCCAALVELQADPAGMTVRDIADAVAADKLTVARYLKVLKLYGLAWSVAEPGHKQARRWFATAARRAA